MKAFNIYMIGVGGQGIGLLSETLLRSADYAGLIAKGVDTHGLAQRGGVVVSHLRLGAHVYSPLIAANDADLVIAMERHEALRGLYQFGKKGGTLIYYNTSWQPLEVRLNRASETAEQAVAEECQKMDVILYQVFQADLADTRMQNIVILANISKYRLIPEIDAEHMQQALQDLLRGPLLERNLELFNRARA